MVFQQNFISKVRGRLDVAHGPQYVDPGLAEIS